MKSMQCLWDPEAIVGVTTMTIIDAATTVETDIQVVPIAIIEAIVETVIGAIVGLTVMIVAVETLPTVVIIIVLEVTVVIDPMGLTIEIATAIIVILVPLVGAEIGSAKARVAIRVLSLVTMLVVVQI